MERSSANVAWNWRDDQLASSRARAEARSRRRGLVQAFVVIAAAAGLRFLLQRTLLADVLFVAGVVVLFAALWRPLWLLPLHRFGQSAGRVAGITLSWLLLVPFFLVFVAPAGLVLRWRGKDALSRRPLAPGLTGWIPRRLEPSPSSMTRQFLVEDRASRRVERPEGPPSGRAWAAAGSGEGREQA